MSYKAATFWTLLPRPALPCNFAVQVPGVLDSITRVWSASIPRDTISETQLNFTGQPIYLPGKSLPNGGTWTCKIYESELFDVALQCDISERMNKIRNMFGQPTGHILRNIFIFRLEQTVGIPIRCCILKGAYLKQVNPVQLNSSSVSEPLSYELVFRYQYADCYGI